MPAKYDQTRHYKYKVSIMTGEDSINMFQGDMDEKWKFCGYLYLKKNLSGQELRDRVLF